MEAKKIQYKLLFGNPVLQEVDGLIVEIGDVRYTITQTDDDRLRIVKSNKMNIHPCVSNVIEID